MTVREGMLEVLAQHVVRKNGYQIDYELAREIAQKMLSTISLILPMGLDESHNLQNKIVVYMEQATCWEVKVFETVADAVVFAASTICETDVVQNNQCIDWFVQRNKIVYHDCEQQKNVVIPA